MRSPIFFLILSAALAAGSRGAEEKRVSPTPSFKLPEVTSEISEGGRFTAAQMAFVQSWLREIAPECPVEKSAVVAQAFLEELAASRPDQFDRLLASDFPVHSFDPMLLRQAGAKLTSPAQAAAREKIAERRVAAVLAQEGRPATETATLIGKMREASNAQYRRLLEGRVEDDDLVAQLHKAGRPVAVAAPVTRATPKELSAAEIVSEFARHNQTGSAILRLQAFVADGKLTTATGEVQQFVISKMRPDRMRLVALRNELTDYILSTDGDRFWQQFPGQPPQYRMGKDMGERRYLGEFADPFFVQEGYVFERLADGSEAGKKFYRIGVRRADGSAYVARIEPDTFRQIGRETADKSVVRYADFREVAGVVFAFREESTDAQGRSGILQFERVIPNPGLMKEYFLPPREPGLDYFQVEKFLTAPAKATLSSR